MSKYNNNDYDFNLKDCSFSFILKCYSLVNIISDVVNSLSLDDNELIGY